MYLLVIKVPELSPRHIEDRTLLSTRDKLQRYVLKKEVLIKREKRIERLDALARARGIVKIRQKSI